MGKKMIALILAGGKGTRLGALTKKIAKPAVSFGGKYRIIDFPLSNCANSQITTVGVVAQYESGALESYVGNGEKWGLNGVHCLTTTLNPRQTEEGLAWYKGTADAIYENLDFIDEQEPDYVLILSGDHIYLMNYDSMLKEHIEHNADLTIASLRVPMEEASRFGIIAVDENKRVTEFYEKPANPKSNLASMGIYIFSYKALRKALIDDAKNEESSHDFGKDIMRKMLNDKKRLFIYEFKGYWKDVGTIASLHEANMDLLDYEKSKDLVDMLPKMKLYSMDTYSHPQYIGRDAKVRDSLVNQGAVILGEIDHCVISNEVHIHKGAKVVNSVVMPGATISEGAYVHDAIVAPGVLVEAGARLGPTEKGKIELIAKGAK